MAFWGRVGLLRFKDWSRQCKRWHSHISRVSLIDCSAEGQRTAEKTHHFLQWRPTEQFAAIRFYAAPVQAKPKKEVIDTGAPRMNQAITSEYVRLVTDEGHSIVSLREALDRAMKLRLDLVEVEQKAKPPVCKIMDYHREKYQRQITKKNRLKSKPEVLKADVKVFRLKGKIEQKDLQRKADLAKRQMERGYRVKFLAEGTEEDDLEGLLSRLSALIEDAAFVESGPFVEQRQAYVLVRHSKFGATKKGRKATKVVEATSTVVRMPKDNNADPVRMPSQTEEVDTSEYGSETEYDVLADDAIHPSEAPINTLADMPECDPSEKTTWSTFNASDDFEKVFGLDDNKNHVASGISHAMGGADTPLREANIEELLHQKLADVSIADGSGKIERQIFERGTSAEMLFGHPASKHVMEAVKAQPTPVKVHIGKVVTPGDISSHSEPSSLVGENRYRGLSELRTKFQQLKPIETISRRTEIKAPPQASNFPPEAERTHVDNGHLVGSKSLQPDRPSLNQRWEARQAPNVTPFMKQKLLEHTPVNGSQKHGQSDAKQGQSASSYGIFSAPKTAACGDQRTSAEENNGSTPSLDRIGHNQDLGKLKTENQRQDADKARQPGWGMFGRDTASPRQHRNTDTQREMQR